MNRVLHVGCGNQPIDKFFAAWEEIRYDIDPLCKPHIVGDILNMSNLDTDYNAVYGSHILEHFYAHQLPIVLKNFKERLKEGGMLVLRVPDLKRVAELIVKGDIEKPVYKSPAGDIYPLDMIYGYRPYIAQGKIHMQHKTGFTNEVLEKYVTEAGFNRVKVRSYDFDLMVVAFV